MLIFKSEPNEKIAKELERDPLVESKQVFAYKNDWVLKNEFKKFDWY